MKIIQIFTHSLSNLFLSPPPIEKIVNLFYGGGWHAILARQILKNSNSYSDIECWSMEKTISKIYRFERGGIIYKLFPSRYFKLGEISILLLKELKEEVKHQNVLVHLHGVFNYTTYFVPLLFRHVPIVVQQHGDKSSLQLFSEYMKSKNPKAFVQLLLYLLNLEWLLERTALRRIERFFVLTDSANAYIANIVGKKKVQRLTMGIDFNLFQKKDKAKTRDSLGLEINRKYILFVGAFVRIKGLDYLLRAFPMVVREYPNTILLLVGDGHYKSNLEIVVKKLGIEKRVIFFPWVENRKLPLYYNAVDAVVLPSLSEGVPSVAMEALACETPFVGTHVGGIPDIVRNFKAGILVPSRDTKALAQGIKEALRREEFRVDCENAKRYYSWENIVKKTIEVYDELFERYYSND